jgi:hypothetical protein
MTYTNGTVNLSSNMCSVAPAGSYVSIGTR